MGDKMIADELCVNESTTFQPKKITSKMTVYFDGFSNGISDRAMYEYRSFLANKMSHAFYPLPRNVNTLSFIATPRNCHDNVDEYCLINPSNKKVEGWFCIQYKNTFTTTFASHSIILLESGEHIDITPTSVTHLSKFLKSFLFSNDYKNLIQYLYDINGQTTMSIKTPD